MFRKTAGSRKRMKIVYLWILAGVTPFSGCAVTRTAEETLPRWMRPWQANPNATAQTSVDAGTAAPPQVQANSAGEATAFNNMRSPYLPSRPSITPAGQGFSPSVSPNLPAYSSPRAISEAPPTASIWAAPPQPFPPPVRLVSDESQFRTWLLRIATNHAVALLRKRVVRAGPSLDDHSSDDTYDEIPHPEYIAVWSETSEDIAMRHETRLHVDEALATLNEKYRVVFVLRDIEEFSTRETAEILGLSQEAVKVRLLRARLYDDFSRYRGKELAVAAES